MFGMDYRYTSEIAMMSTSLLEPTELTDYREEFVLSLSMERELVRSFKYLESLSKVQEV